MNKYINSKEELYDNCENMEELYDKHYVPLLEELYHSEEKFRIRSKSYNNILLENTQLTEEKEELIKYLEQQIENEKKVQKFLYENENTKLVEKAKVNSAIGTYQEILDKVRGE